LSNEFIALALRSDVASTVQIAVLLVLADAANADGVCWPSVDHLAEASRAGRSTVLRVLAEFEEDGYLTRRRRRAQSSVYTLNRERLSRKSRSGTSQSETSQSETPKVPERDRSIGTPKGTQKRPKSKTAKKAVEEHPDARKLCDRLVELMVANKCKKPTIGKAWLDAARLLLTKDGRTFEDALSVLEWSQANTFWRGNIESMPTFREKYDRLRLAAEGRGELKAPAPRLDSADAVRSWLKDEWRAGRTSEIERRTGLRYALPDLPLNTRGAEAAAAFYAEHARNWITEHVDELVSRMTRKVDAA
jgi:DNA-binding transcriptional ArsR family regulator